MTTFYGMGKTGGSQITAKTTPRPQLWSTFSGLTPKLLQSINPDILDRAVMPNIRIVSEGRYPASILKECLSGLTKETLVWTQITGKGFSLDRTPTDYSQKTLGSEKIAGYLNYFRAIPVGPNAFITAKIADFIIDKPYFYVSESGFSPDFEKALPTAIQKTGLVLEINHFTESVILAIPFEGVKIIDSKFISNRAKAFAFEDSILGD